MQVICISRGTLSGGDELAERLARKLGCACLSREQLIEAATKEGIRVGRLEMAMIKPRIFSQQLDLERDHYLAFTTAYLCDRAMEGPLVYHGRTGHLLLPGVEHVLSVRVVADEERRIATVMQKLGLDRDKARKYVKEVDEDRTRWARSMYGVGWEDAAHYDFVINLQHMTVENAASALTVVAQLPDFQMTPASQKAMLNLRLAAKARVALARHDRTSRAKVKVRADDGVVTVTFLPQDSRCAGFVSESLASVEGVREIRTTLASTTILWVQERFDPASESFQEVTQLATKWQAAVELLRLAPPEAAPAEALDAEAPTRADAEDGGVQDDAGEETGALDDGGVKETLDQLALARCCGGAAVVCGGAQELLDALDRSLAYSLVVIGDVFLEKARAVRLRMTRELRRFISDYIRAPVVGAEELKTEYLFGPRDLARLAGFLAFVLLLYFLVFSNQEAILRFLRGGWWGGNPLANILAAVAVFAFVPIIAHSYGAVAKSLMKLIKME